MTDQTKTHGGLNVQLAAQCNAMYRTPTAEEERRLAEACRAIAAPQSPVAPADHDLLEVARATGLRQLMHGVNAIDARLILQRFVGALRFLRIDSDVPTVNAQPVATLHDDGYYTFHGNKPHGYCYAGWRMDVYAAPTPPTSAADAETVRQLTDEEIERGREATFSTNNPYCPCDRKSFNKAVRWAERAIAASKGTT